MPLAWRHLRPHHGECSRAAGTRRSGLLQGSSRRERHQGRAAVVAHSSPGAGVDEGSVGVLRRPHDAPGAALPLHCEHLVPDLQPGRRVETEVSVERPAIKAPSDGQLRRVFHCLGVPEAAGGENAGGEGLPSRARAVASSSSKPPATGSKSAADVRIRAAGEARRLGQLLPDQVPQKVWWTI